MIFPASLCGMWTLVACSNPQYLGANMVVDYSNFKFSHYVKKYGTFSVRKNVYGSVFLSDTTTAKVIWSKNIHYTLESAFLPRIPVPWDTKCPRFRISYSLDETGNQLTIVKSNEKYVFQKHYVSLDNNDHFYKIFMTQLVFDLILRNLPH